MTIDFAYALQCPKVVTGTTFVHQVVPGVSAQSWGMDITYSSQGWTVVSNPLTENSQAKTVSSSDPLIVKFTVVNNNPTAFNMMCEYQIESGPYPLALSVTNNVTNKAPVNKNFTKISDTQYVCRTDGEHPEFCSDGDALPVNCGLGQPC